jgi:acylphosphatase
MPVRLHVVFRGRVQGVFFRDNARRRAGELGVRGWVRNLQDSSVEAIAEGDEQAVLEWLKWCREDQPRARVTSVDVKREDYRGEFEGFEIRY